MLDHEDELLKRACRGDDDALAVLLDHYGPMVRGSLYGRIDRRWQAVLSEDDVMQETYADAFLGISRFEPGGDGSFGRWLTALAHHNLIDATRALSAARAGGARKNQAAHSLEDSFADLLAEISASTTSPSQKVLRTEAAEMLRSAIERLPEAYRLVITLYDLEGQPVEEVVQRLGCSAGAMHMRRARALALLKTMLATSG